MPMPSAHIQEDTISGMAPKAWAAWNTIATELVKPTSTATKPAVKAERLKSLKNRIADEPRLDFDLRAEFDHGVVRQPEEVGRPAGVVVHLGEQLLAPGRHAAAEGR